MYQPPLSSHCPLTTECEPSDKFPDQLPYLHEARQTADADKWALNQVPMLDTYAMKIDHAMSYCTSTSSTCALYVAIGISVTPCAVL